jgi:hypothetical protein
VGSRKRGRERGGEEIEESKGGRENRTEKGRERVCEKFEMGEKEKREYFSVRST